MKKNLFGWLAMAAMLVGTGCSTDEVVNDYSPENAIQFGTYVGRDAQSRVSVTDIRVLEEATFGFGVFANYSTNNGVALTPNIINNTKVTWSGSAWTYSPVKYWPNNGTDQVTFWAYGPWNTGNTNKEAIAPHFAISDGTDYVATNPVSHKKTTVDDVNDKVMLTFKHMMSKVGFKVEAIVDELENEDKANGKVDESSDETRTDIDSNTKIVVTQVTLSGDLVTSGTYTYGDVPSSDPVRQDWNLNSNSATSETYTLTSADLKSPTDVTYYTKNDVTEKINGQVVTNASAQLNDNDEYLMLIPQEATINITVHYSVITQDSNLDGGYSKVDNVISSNGFSFSFDRGKAYNFVLHLGMTSVQFDATINEWDETESDRIVHVPLNIKDNNN